MDPRHFAADLTTDQLQVLLAIDDHGSFSAAARALRRTQGSVSYHIGRLEDQLGLSLFDRTGHKPRLTPAGRRVLGHARRVVAQLDALRHTAWGLGAGLEPTLSLAVDIIVPPAELRALLDAIRGQFPSIGIEVVTGIWNEPADRVRSGDCQIGIAPNSTAADLARTPFRVVEFLPVVAPDHPLATLPDLPTAADLASYPHMVLPADDPFPRHSNPSTWRIGDTHMRHALIREGLGWARLPREQVAADLASGHLVELRSDIPSAGRFTVELALFHDPARPAGPATRWTLDHQAATVGGGSKGPLAR